VWEIVWPLLVITGADHRRWPSQDRRLIRLFVALIVMLATALMPGSAAPSAHAAAACAPTNGMDFLASKWPTVITAPSFTATQISYLGSGTVTLGDCTVVTGIPHYQLTAFKASNLSLVSDSGPGGYTVSLKAATGTTSILGGYDSSGSPMTTDLWGHITNISVCVTFLGIPLPVCCFTESCVQGWTSWLTINGAGSNFAVTAYGARVIDTHPGTTAKSAVNLNGELKIVRNP
jgi:hypothetical protein